jgi:hypothetical protein
MRRVTGEGKSLLHWIPSWHCSYLTVSLCFEAAGRAEAAGWAGHAGQGQALGKADHDLQLAKRADDAAAQLQKLRTSEGVGGRR